MSTSQARTCPICDKVASPRAENQAFPFCSRRCRLMDLSAWLSEAYRVPISVTERRLIAELEN